MVTVLLGCTVLMKTFLLETDWLRLSLLYNSEPRGCPRQGANSLPLTCPCVETLILHSKYWLGVTHLRFWNLMRLRLAWSTGEGNFNTDVFTPWFRMVFAKSCTSIHLSLTHPSPYSGRNMHSFPSSRDPCPLWRSPYAILSMGDLL